MIEIIPESTNKMLEEIQKLLYFYAHTVGEHGEGAISEDDIGEIMLKIEAILGNE